MKRLLKIAHELSLDPDRIVSAHLDTDTKKWKLTMQDGVAWLVADSTVRPFARYILGLDDEA